MKFIAIAFLALASTAHAGTTATSTSTTSSQSQAAASNAGNSQNINSYAPGKIVDYSAPPVVAPALAASLAGCFGSVSGGASWVPFGISFGGTHVDHDCERRANAAALVELHREDIAMQIMCLTPEVRKADAKTDHPICR